MNKLKHFSIFLGICYLIVSVLLLVMSSIFAYTNISDQYLDIAVYSIVAISIFISSLLLNRKIKEKGIIWGTIFGIIAIAILFLLGAIFFAGLQLSYITAIYFAIGAVAGLLGGVIGVNI